MRLTTSFQMTIAFEIKYFMPSEKLPTTAERNMALMFDERALSDVVFKLETDDGRTLRIYAMKRVLVAACAYFHQLLESEFDEATPKVDKVSRKRRRSSPGPSSPISPLQDLFWRDQTETGKPFEEPAPDKKARHEVTVQDFS